jgi:hypothetical protein
MKNLYELQKEINEKRLYQKLLMEKIYLLRCKTEPGTVKINEVVTKKNNIDKTKIIDKIIEYEKEIELLQEEIDLYKPILEELEKLLKEYNDIYQLIYFEYYIKGYSAEKIGLRYNYSRAQVYNIINKIDEDLKNKTLDKIRLRV